MESMEVKTAAVQLLFLQYLSRAPMPNSRKIQQKKASCRTTSMFLFFTAIINTYIELNF